MSAGKILSSAYEPMGKPPYATLSPTLKFLLISGKPIGEPIARGGPFVMNTKKEILKAMEDYQSGNFVQK